MKRIVLLVFLVFPMKMLVAQSDANGNLGVLPTLNGRIYYSGVDSVGGVVKDDLFNRAKNYLSTMFPNFKDVVKLDDKDLGKITIRGLFNTKPKGNGIIVTYIDFMATTTIMVKDGKYRFEISDFVSPTGSISLPYIPLEQLMFNRKTIEKRSPMIDNVIKGYLEGLDSAMKSSEKQNW